MARDIYKALQECETHTAKTGRDPFYFEDVCLINERAKEGGEFDAFKAISDALKIGYGIGYRTAKREAQKHSPAQEA